MLIFWPKMPPPLMSTQPRGIDQCEGDLDSLRLEYLLFGVYATLQIEDSFWMGYSGKVYKWCASWRPFLRVQI